MILLIHTKEIQKYIKHQVKKQNHKAFMHYFCILQQKTYIYKYIAFHSKHFLTQNHYYRHLL